MVFVRPPRVGHDHGSIHAAVGYWLVSYAWRTAGVSAANNVTTILGPRDEVQPDAALRVCRGGLTSVRPDDFLAGCPELVCEVVDGRTESHDLTTKRQAYAAHGAREYVAVVLTTPRRVIWWSRDDGSEFRPVPPDSDGIHRSRAFPGLWLDPAALVAGDLNRLATVVEQGLATPEHAPFVAQLAGRQP